MIKMKQLAGIRISGCPRDTRDGDVQMFVEKYGRVKSVTEEPEESTGKVYTVKLECYGDLSELPGKVGQSLFRSRDKVQVSLVNLVDEHTFRPVPWLWDERSNPFMFHPKDSTEKRR